MAAGKIVRDLKAIYLGLSLDDSIGGHVWQSGAESSKAGGIILSSLILACSPNLLDNNRRTDRRDRCY